MANVDSVLSGRTSVHPSGVIGALEQIRRDAAAMDAQRDRESGAEAAPRVRATLSNLLILVTEPGGISRQELDGVLTDLCVTYPSRFMVIGYEPPGAAAATEGDANNNTLKTAVSSRCVKASSGLHLCSEEVYIAVRPETVELVPSLLRSLLVPDVDTVLLLFGDPVCCREGGSDGSRLRQLIGEVLGLCDLLIVDSRSFSTFRASFDCLDEIIDTIQRPEEDELPERDLNWIRLARWRFLVAEQFDRPIHGKSTDDISKIRLRCGMENGCLPADALLIAGWIHSSLGLTPVRRTGSGEQLGIESQWPDGRPVQFDFMQAENAPAELRMIEFLLGRSEQDFTRISLIRPSGDSELTICTESTNVEGISCELFFRKVPYISESFENLVFAGLGAPAAVSQYARALKLSRQITALLEPTRS